MKKMAWVRWMVCMIPLVLLAGPQAKNEGQEPKRTAAPERPGRLTLPKEAVKIEPFTYRYKDPGGKVWIYRQTPFGLVRYEEPKQESRGSGSAAARPEAPPPGLKAFDEGDSIRFERMGPFGKYTWRRKKGDLTREERLAWEAAQKSRTGGGAGSRAASAENDKSSNKNKKE